MTVFIVTHEYEPVSVWSTREKAEAEISRLLARKIGPDHVYLDSYYLDSLLDIEEAQVDPE